MAERRMIANTIVDSDAFVQMPLAAQALYFHLNQRADDEGFVNKPQGIMRQIGCRGDHAMKVLVERKFVISFESGVIVIKHWKINNYIQKDRFHETKYKDEKALLESDENGSYRCKREPCIQPGHKPDTEVRGGKVRQGKSKSERGDLAPYGRMENVLLTEKEYEAIINKYQAPKGNIDKISLYLKNAPRKYEDHYALIEKIAAEDNWARKKVIEELPIIPTNPITEEERAAILEKCKGIFASVPE